MEWSDIGRREESEGTEKGRKKERKEVREGEKKGAVESRSLINLVRCRNTRANK